MVDILAGLWTEPGPPVVTRADQAAPRPRPDDVARTNLVDRFLASPARLTSISGPAGAGKSTFMAQCHRAVPGAVWLSLGPADNDPVVFWTALLTSLDDAVGPTSRAHRQRLALAGPAVIDEIATEAANELHDVDAPPCIFLDDLHVIEDDRCLRSLSRFIRCLPGVARVVVASRTEPPLPFARLRPGGDLLEITEGDLALSATEAAQLLGNVCPDLRPGLVDELVTRTEGWPAGLGLAATALARSDDVDATAHAFGGRDRTVADYLIAEVLDGLSPGDREFILDTAILTRLTGDLCDAVTLRSGGDERLRALERANVFVVSLDDEGAWYRYHHLFAELLSAEIRRRPRSEVEALHSRAFDWHRDSGLVDEATHHALAAGRREEGADLVCEHWLGLFQTGRLATALRLIERFDQREILGYQPLASAAAFAYGLAGDRARARTCLDATEHADHRGAAPDGTASKRSSLAITRSGLALNGIDQALVEAELAHSLEPPGSPWRPMAALIVGLARVMKGDKDGSTAYLEEASVSGDTAVAAYAHAELALGHLGRDDPERARANAESARRMIDDNDLEDLVAAAVTGATWGLLHLAAGDRAAAREALDTAAGPMTFVGDALPMDAMHASLLLAELALGVGARAEADGYVEIAVHIEATTADTGAMGSRLTELRHDIERMPVEPATVEQDWFTERELEVVDILPKGLTTREIGEELFLSRNTIKTYLRRVYRKLGVSSRDGAVRRARALGLIPADPAAGSSKPHAPASASESSPPSPSSG